MHSIGSSRRFPGTLGLLLIGLMMFSTLTGTIGSSRTDAMNVSSSMFFGISSDELLVDGVASKDLRGRKCEI